MNEKNSGLAVPLKQCQGLFGVLGLPLEDRRSDWSSQSSLSAGTALNAQKHKARFVLVSHRHLLSVR